MSCGLSGTNPPKRPCEYFIFVFSLKISKATTPEIQSELQVGFLKHVICMFEVGHGYRNSGVGWQGWR